MIPKVLLCPVIRPDYRLKISLNCSDCAHADLLLQFQSDGVLALLVSLESPFADVIADQNGCKDTDDGRTDIS